MKFCNQPYLLMALASLGTSAAAAQSNEAGGTSGKLEEVIVTAERRESSLQKVAMTIAAITDEELTRGGVLNARELLDSVSGLEMVYGSTSSYIGLYGIVAGGNMWADAVMSYNYGGIPLARQTSAASSIYDVERVEVLKGPQGTLYGRNSNVGAMNVVIRRPTDEFEGTVDVTLGNYNAVNTKAAVNLPISEKVSARFAMQTTRHDGYFSNGYDDANNFGARASTLFKLTDDVELLVWADIYRNRQKGGNVTSAYYLSRTQRWIKPNDPWFGLGAAGTCSNQLLCPSYAHASIGGVNAQTPAGGFADTSATGLAQYSVIGDDGFWDADQDIYAAQLDWRTGIGKLTVLAAHVDTYLDFLSYYNGLRFTNTTDARQESLEIRLASDSDGRLNWVLGGFYYYETQNAFQNQLNSAGWQMLYTPNLTDENYAFFGDVVYSLTERLRAIAGVRFTHEEKTQDGYSTATGLSPASMATFTAAGSTCYAASVAAKVQFRGSWFPANFCVFPNGGDYSDDSVSWKAGVEFDFTADSMGYATVRTGTKAGGFTSGTDNTYRPETLTAYELGAKNRFADGRLQANISAFYWDIHDEQLRQLQQYFVNGIAVGQTNYPFNVEGYIEGVELDVQAYATPHDLVRLNALNVRGKWDRTPTFTSSVGTTISQKNASRYNLPEWHVTPGYNHIFDLPGGSSLDFGVNAHYESKTNLVLVDEPGLQPGDRKPSFIKYDTSLSYASPDNKWRVTAFVDNVTNEAIVGTTPSGQVVPGVAFKVSTNPFGNRGVSLEAPRTYGLRFNASF